jgi:hypothetical protein
MPEGGEAGTMVGKNTDTLQLSKVCFCHYTNMDIYSASSLKQQCVGTHDASPRKIILFPCQPEPVFALTPFNYDYQNIYTSKNPQLYLYEIDDF